MPVQLGRETRPSQLYRPSVPALGFSYTKFYHKVSLGNNTEVNGTERKVDALNIQWVERVQDMVDVNAPEHRIVPLAPGLEATVAKVESENGSYVLKVWNKQAKPDIGKQYNLLSALHRQGLCVSKPYGWGIDSDHNQVLLTSYDGIPISRLDKEKLKRIARMLVEVHRCRVNESDFSNLLHHEFIAYFFPAIEMHNDLHDVLLRLLENVELSQDRLIHGDYNLGNILEESDRFTIIDWTNGQLGDPRYDIAWSVLLMRVYVGERYGGLYYNEFLKLGDYRPEDLEVFEAIASIRWLLLDRIAGLPKGPSTMKRIKTLVQNNRYIHENLI